MEVGGKDMNNDKRIAQVIELVENYDHDLDNEGQVVIYTGIYVHDNGKYYNFPQEEDN